MSRTRARTLPASSGPVTKMSGGTLSRSICRRNPRARPTVSTALTSSLFRRRPCTRKEPGRYSRGVRFQQLDDGTPGPGSRSDPDDERHAHACGLGERQSDSRRSDAAWRHVGSGRIATAHVTRSLTAAHGPAAAPPASIGCPSMSWERRIEIRSSSSERFYSKSPCNASESIATGHGYERFLRFHHVS